MRPLLAVAAVLLLPLTAGCLPSGPDDTDDGGPAPRVGDVLPHALGSDVEGRHAVVVVPGRRYDFLVGSPGRDIDDTTASDQGVGRQTADGAEAVQVSWSLDAPDGDWFAAVAEDDPAIPFALLVDGEEYPVGELDQEGVYAAYVVVPEGADDIGLQVTYGDVTQVVDDVSSGVDDKPRDVPAHLYTDPPRLEAEVSREGLGGDYTGAEASTRVLSPSPYVTGLGWAPAGRSWLLVDVRVEGALAGVDAGGEYVEYEVTGGEVVVRLDGEEPQQLLAYGSPRPDDDARIGDDPSATGLGDTWSAQAVFDVPDDLTGGEVTVRRAFSAVPEDRDEARRLGAPADLDRTLRYTRDLAF